jgi:hypothetical protein
MLFADGSDADFVLISHGRSFRVHKYIFAVNSPKNQFDLTGDSQTLVDSIVPSSDIFEILLHYIYALGTLHSLRL